MNVMADRALLGAYAQNMKTVSRPVLRQAVREVLGEKHNKRSQASASGPFVWILFALLLLAVGALLLTTNLNNQEALSSKPASEAVPALSVPTINTDAIETAETVTVEPVASDPLPALPDATREIPLIEDRDAAFIPLFATWGVRYEPEIHGPACNFAPTQQLSCLRQQGDIAAMRNLDRPALLSISDREGALGFAPIIAMVGTKVAVASADTIEEHELSQLLLQSHNDFTILWRTPEGYRGPVRPGHRGPMVRLLAEKVALAQDQKWIGTTPLLYDAGLKERVKSFQRAQGLTSDGVAGPQTWIRLNSFTEKQIPMLHGKPERGVVR